MNKTLCTGVLALADDLSGAAETAAALSRTASIRIELRSPVTPGDARNTHKFPLWGSGEERTGPLVLDLDTRQSSAARTEHAVRETLAAETSGNTPVLLKIDSLARGNIGAVIRAARGGPVVLAPSLPIAGRTVRDGVIHVHGQPLRRTRTWRVEETTAPENLAQAIAPSACRELDLDTVRSPELHAAIAECAAQGLVAVCDAETDTDLDTVVAAASCLSSPRLVGSGGLAAAIGRVMSEEAAPPAREPAPARQSSERPLLIVVGTAEPGAVEQVRVLTDLGARLIELDVVETPEELTADVHARLRSELRRGPVVLTAPLGGEVVAGRSRTFVRLLAETARRAVTDCDSPVDLVLTGGETARRVLDAVGVDALRARGQIHHGAVHSHTPDGTSVVTRPGSFGGPDSLVRIVRHLRPTWEG
ncbi:four-carbon acid sugar kinase family protein [Actinopolyspora sp. H202]|uniref:four-carbon acid sugar kinase family protein n=1 Tax=Actinopolyspora sp. H202 TaxID=1500456 RepID=UPI003EE70503